MRRLRRHRRNSRANTELPISGRLSILRSLIARIRAMQIKACRQSTLLGQANSYCGYN
jgi:hypothetical protein